MIVWTGLILVSIPICMNWIQNSDQKEEKEKRIGFKTTTFTKFQSLHLVQIKSYNLPSTHERIAYFKPSLINMADHEQNQHQIRKYKAHNAAKSNHSKNQNLNYSKGAKICKNIAENPIKSPTADSAC